MIQVTRFKIIISIFLTLFAASSKQALANETTTPTTIIGTPEQPTIEGGIINVPNKKQDQTNFTNDISDEFRNDQNIKSILKNAAKDGKLSYVLQRAEQLKLPATVALIPMVESHYQTNAISSKGAMGAWQLMPKTAKDYGVTTKQRENFIASTDAALNLLSDLHRQFDNWTLAFAAYNAGSTRVKCALANNPGAKRINDLDLSLETKRYIRQLSSIHQILIYNMLNCIV